MRFSSECLPRDRFFREGVAAPPRGCGQENVARNVEVVATCSHDTGAAVAAVPATYGDDWTYLSSGTWSLVGVELPLPLISEKVRAHNFTNEAGYGGTTRFLKNNSGLYILQKLRKEWAKQGHELECSTLTLQALEASPFRSIIRPDAPQFAKPGGMPQKITTFWPRNRPACVGNARASHAPHFRESRPPLSADVDRDRATHRRTIRQLHNVGGGSQSSLLNQFAASATGRAVLAGPVKAMAVGEETAHEAVPFLFLITWQEAVAAQCRSQCVDQLRVHVLIFIGHVQNMNFFACQHGGEPCMQPLDVPSAPCRKSCPPNPVFFRSPRTRAPASVPADRACKPGTPSKRRSAVGLRPVITAANE